jgi:hypothetical protein
MLAAVPPRRAEKDAQRQADKAAARAEKADKAKADNDAFRVRSGDWREGGWGAAAAAAAAAAATLPLPTPTPAANHPIQQVFFTTKFEEFAAANPDLEPHAVNNLINQAWSQLDDGCKARFMQQARAMAAAAKVRGCWATCACGARERSL